MKAAQTIHQTVPQRRFDRARGALLGLAVGDAIGTTVEFKPCGSFAPLTDMVGGGPFDRPPGQWTNDTVDPENDFVLPPPKKKNPKMRKRHEQKDPA